MRGVGSPRGGRVHWLIWHLDKDFKKEYTILFDYNEHNYVCLRYKKRKIYDIFVVWQSSKHYWQCTYVNVDKWKFEHFGDNTTRRIAKRMWYLWKFDKLYW